MRAPFLALPPASRSARSRRARRWRRPWRPPARAPGWCSGHRRKAPPCREDDGEAGAAGEAGQPGQPLLAGRDIFVLMGVGARNEKAVKPRRLQARAQLLRRGRRGRDRRFRRRSGKGSGTFLQIRQFYDERRLCRSPGVASVGAERGQRPNIRSRIDSGRSGAGKDAPTPLKSPSPSCPPPPPGHSRRLAGPSEGRFQRANERGRPHGAVFRLCPWRLSRYLGPTRP